MNAHDLEFIARNVGISASLITRMLMGETERDWPKWEAEVLSRATTFLEDELWALGNETV